MDGVLIIDKPAGPTSHDVVARVRRVFRTRKVGHTGTLDPFATGVMTILAGKATRLARFVERDEKEYEAEICFGTATDTGDTDGRVFGEPGRSDIAAEELADSLAHFRGEIEQTPPMYSAKKVGGNKLYELAREGKEIERNAVPIVIYASEIISGTPARGPLHRIRVRCSAGTYIRTLAEDIAASIGTNAHLAALRRIASGRFTIADSVPLDELEAAPEPHKYLLPMEELVSTLPSFMLNAESVRMTLNGLSTRVYDREFTPGEHIAMFSEEKKLVAVGYWAADERELRPQVVLGESR